MKKFTLILLLLPFLAFSQKLKTKKDRILIDEKEVAIFKEPVRDQYQLFDLKGNKQFTVEYKGMSEGKTILNQWLLLTSADESKKTEIPYEVLINSLSPSRIMFHLLSAKYELFDENGFNQSKIDAFFNTQRESISDKTLKTKMEVVSSKKDKQEKVARYRPFVKNDGTIMFGGTAGTNIVGKAMSSTYTAFGNNNTVNVYDLDNVQVATARATGNMNNDVEVTLFNDSKFTYPAEKRFAGPDNSSFVKELIEELVYRDITLGHQAKSYNRNLMNEKIKLAKERSRNIYNVNGYAFDEKGTRYDGIITAQFEKLDINQTGDTQVVDAIDNYGKNVSIKYKNEKGKERTITLSAKDNVRFFVKNSDGSETGYEGMKVKGDAMKKLSNAMSLGFNNAYFYEVIHNSKGNSVLVDPVEDDRFVIKLKNKSEGQMIDKRNNEKLTVQLAEYLSGCKKLAAEIKKGAFDLKNSENLINIVNEYNDCE
ncbi:hypothetical protein [Flavobacterium cerinum]|uniref:Uncharacterized protein n=1 Tax=Flavobacterium cerinum TaxID=2502784 RepID=A0ABY5IRL4_9FLAO|nr:hypothetical protein [Flavobacterium cerinum]UUC45458.1 hypothetical protein NOX80_17775 [Flavobacterium cerinum]